MFSVTTSELRWFGKGNIPGSVQNWFDAANGLFENEGVRIDHYLYLSGNKTTGIKFRQGRLEVKHLIENTGAWEINPTVKGKLEVWKKWSVESNENNVNFDAEWIAVEKSRSVRKFIFTNEGKPTSGFNFYKSDGCNLELTRIIASKELWWSLGLETYGDKQNLILNLKTTTNSLFKNIDLKELSMLNSFAYPEWLLTYFSIDR